MDLEARTFWKIAEAFKGRALVEGPERLHVTTSRHYVLVMLEKREEKRSLAVRYRHDETGSHLSYSLPAHEGGNIPVERELAITEANDGTLSLSDDLQRMNIPDFIERLVGLLDASF